MGFLVGLDWIVILKSAGITLGVILVALALAYPKTREAMAGLGLRLAEIALLFFEKHVTAEKRFEHMSRMARSRASK
jgi:hypothetical protein